jgi:hypothetical protein
MDVLVEEVEELTHHTAMYAGVSASQDVGPEEDNGPGSLDAEGSTDSGGVASYEVALELREVSGLNGESCQVPEAGIDSVDSFAALEDLVDGLARSVHCTGSIGGQLDALALTGDSFEFLKT